MKKNSIELFIFVIIVAVSVQKNQAQDVNIRAELSLLEATATGRLQLDNKDRAALFFPDCDIPSKRLYSLPLDVGWKMLRNSVEQVRNARISGFAGFSLDLINAYGIIMLSNFPIAVKNECINRIIQRIDKITHEERLEFAKMRLYDCIHENIDRERCVDDAEYEKLIMIKKLMVSLVKKSDNESLSAANPLKDIVVRRSEHKGYFSCYSVNNSLESFKRDILQYQELFSKSQNK